MGKEWFETWFDTHYYHLLYKNRNEVEARRFIDALLRFLNPEPESRFVDIACGKGRHSKYLSSKGYDVVGLDLSRNSIEEACRCTEGFQNLRFYQHDIRNPFPVSNLDYGVNFFTSFGYFDSDDEHEVVLKNIFDCLNPGGRFVLDYLNVSEVMHNLKNEDQKQVEGVQFRIKRFVENNAIVKRISVVDGAKNYEFKEQVRAFDKEQLVEMIEAQGFLVDEVFGDYQLNAYTPHSPRVLIIAQKRP